VPFAIGVIARSKDVIARQFDSRILKYVKRDLFLSKWHKERATRSMPRARLVLTRAADDSTAGGQICSPCSFASASSALTTFKKGVLNYYMQYEA
jgi:hypothetical protein